MSKFIWGTATASIQIEGAAHEDGRTPSIWDTFAHTPGKIIDGTNADIASDHYHRWQEDVEIIKNLGVDAYRFSFSWTRLFPTDGGAWNEKGFAFYDRLIDALLENKIQPWATMFHWDLPQYLQDKGGWTDRATVDRFVDFSAAVTERIKDRVRHIMLINEPSVVSVHGYANGCHAPGLRDREKWLASTHHLNLGIGRGFRRLKAIDPNLTIGSTYTVAPIRAATLDDNGMKGRDLIDAAWNRNYFDPLLKGTYPKEFADAMKHYIKQGDMEECHTPIDFVGLQHYAPSYAELAPDDKIIGARNAAAPEHFKQTDIGWMIEPAGFTELLTAFKHTYGDVPLYITENGACFNDGLSDDGKVHDSRRVAFLQDYIQAMMAAKAQGVDVRGYFVWSLFDNFEWAEGLKMRFGIVHVDYANDCKRTPKDSYYWYRVFLKNNKKT